ncbi:MAG: M67 family metallopeptidase [Pacificimonas sp.]
MIWRITRAAAEAVRAHARRDMPDEACGLLLGSGRAITEARPARNLAVASEAEFEIDPAALFRAHREQRAGGPDILGYYHSHPNGIAAPSATDAVRAAPDGKLWIIATEDGISAFVAGDAGLHGCFQPIELEQG